VALGAAVNTTQMPQWRTAIKAEHPTRSGPMELERGQCRQPNDGSKIRSDTIF